ncbi:uncharacterized protein LOC116055796 [Sander lucioperca]|uniref:uncharacterized protein LOC116055796 n=1 Tax=Sander lucioperca TaxID=283035 RepID=UPI001653C5E9|nr:uncharacterized protein LOC116055796 [Sander lucioperca]
MADPELQRREEFLVEGEPFRQNAFLIINEMVAMERQKPNRVLVDEVHHSIFFLGKINTPPFPPEMILSDAEVLNAFKSLYPGPFEKCSSQVPRRSPFSCVLDMVVYVTGQVNEGAIIQQLQQFIGELRGGINKKPLVSKAICVSQSKSPGSVRYYGVSMSTDATGRKKVLIGASCLRIWHTYVADAVMTFYPEKATGGFARKTYFDGTIRVPEQNVRCVTFDLYNGEVKPPCKSCRELFGLTGGATEATVPYGNCAEAESLSNLFRVDEAVRDQVPAPTGGDRARAERTVLEAHRGLVRSFPVFNQWTDHFYIPQ